jgi:ATP-dependent exoDNAse (exonuclease V) alpha subunit
MTQEQAFEILKTGANVFLTGEPGSGKTHTVNRYIEYLEQRGVDPSITASTGIAATHVGGMTIHSWSGIGVRSRLTEWELDQLSEKERLVKRLMAAKVLIIDEISMLSKDTLDSVEAVCRKLRRSHEAWGGLQVIFVGDFFQLPPVERAQSMMSPIDMQDTFFGDDEPLSNFAYHAQAWKRAKPLVCYLTEQHRQDDESFLSVLASVRRGEVVEELKIVLRARAIVPEEEGITRLFPKNQNVDTMNDKELAKLHGKPHIFEMTSRGFPAVVEGLKKNCLSPETLILKMGAKVMFTKNAIDGKYVNGTLGEVVDFSRTNGQPIVLTRDKRQIEVTPAEWTIEDQGKVVASIEQLPLRLAWAITVHKSQGMSLDAAVIDLRTAFEYGQGYVALSRVRSLEGLFLEGFNERALQVHPEVLEVDAEFRGQSSDAEAAFVSMDQEEIATMQRDFLKGIGGSEKVVARDRSERKQKVSTFEETKELVLSGKSISDVAKERKLTEGTIVSHLERLVEDRAIDPHKDLAHLMPNVEDMAKMQGALIRVKTDDGTMPLSPARDILQNRYTFEELRLARLFL